MKISGFVVDDQTAKILVLQQKLEVKYIVSEPSNKSVFTSNIKTNNSSVMIHSPVVHIEPLENVSSLL